MTVTCCLDDLVAGRPQRFAAMLQALQPALPLLGDLAATAQDPVWHAEGSVAAHTELVVEQLERMLQQQQPRLSARAVLVLRLGALLHDIGKPLVSRRRGAEGDQRIVAPGHAERGAGYLGCRLVTLPGLPADVALATIALVRHHHDPLRLVRKNRPASDIRALWRKTDPRLLELLARADMRGRRCDDQAEQLELVQLYRLLLQEQQQEAAGPGGMSHRALVAPMVDALGSEHDTEMVELAVTDAVRDWEARRIHSPAEALARFRARRQQRSDPQRGGQLLLTCGPSGSGKSSWVARLDPSWQRVCLDDLREEVTGQRGNQRHNARVVKLAREQLRQALRSEGRVVWDATSLRRSLRRNVLQTARDYGAHTTLVVCCAAPAVLQARNARRDRPVPARVLQRQLATFEWPDDDEAHRLLFVDAEGRVLRDSRTWWRRRAGRGAPVHPG